MTEHTGCSGLVWWQGLITLGPETPRPKAAAERLARLRLLLLGPMTARDGRGRDVLPRVRKTRGVLAVLALASPRPVLREELTGLFWSGRGRAQARASLRQCVHELQDMLLPIGEDVLRSDRTHLVLSNEGLWVDVHAMATGGSDSLELLRGTLLQDLVGLDPAFDRWLATERRKVATLARSAADQVLVGTAGPEAAIAAASRLVALDPGDEDTWRILISLHMAQGDQESAELAYNRCGAALAACTGVAPSNETRALLEVSDGLPAAAAARATPPASPPRGLHPGVRLGVMPLRVLDGTGDDSLSLGLAEEITTALSRFRWISCIASTAMARFAGDGGAGSEPLDLDFLLDGTVQRGRSRVRVNVRLLDVRAGGEVVWAQRFDRDAADLLSLQDEIAAETVAQVDPELLLLEGTRASSRPAAGSNAYDLTIRAIPAVYRLDRAGYDLAGEMLAAAVAADPAHAAAHAWWAYWHLFLVGQGWAADPVRAMARAESLAEQAVILDPGDARALTLAGHVRAFLHRRVEEGIALHERALSLNPNLALAWTFLSLAQTYAGRPDEGLEAARQSKRLAPLDPHGFMVDAALMLSHLIRGEHEVVAEIGRRTTGLAPGFTANWKLYLSSLGHLRRMEQSAVVRDQLLRLEPGFTIRAAIERSPLLRAEDRIVYGDGLRLAGLPD